MDLETRLVALGDHLDLDRGRDVLSEHVTARISTAAAVDAEVDRDGGRGRWFRFAAAVLLVAAVAAVAVPASRDAIAGWFGLDGVRIERRQDLDTPEAASPSASVDGDGSGLPGPGESREVTVDGRVVLVSVIEGVLTDEVIVKTLGPDTEIVEVAVANAPGLWISGAPHDLAYLSPDGTVAFERVAGNTLVWQDDQTIGRLEGFKSVDDAIEFATELGTID